MNWPENSMNINSMKIEIKPGKWRMRNGECAVVEFRTDADTNWPWLGYLETNKDCNSWNDNGNFDRNGFANDYDLIEPWTDKPVVNWAAMPAWAKWVAMDEDGRWGWFAEKPFIKDSCWFCNSSEGGISSKYTPSFSGNWRDSLVERPSA